MKVKAFTLIELLIVIAIIAILALIAIPNFLEAQTRAKVARALSDLRAIGDAVESYAIDYGAFPPNDGMGNAVPLELTTPLAYIIQAKLIDPFSHDTRDLVTSNAQGYVTPYYTYLAILTMDQAIAWEQAGRPIPFQAIDHFTRNRNAFLKYGNWLLMSKGPDGVTYEIGNYSPMDYVVRSEMLYAPTNGTMSAGNIIRTQRDPEGRIFVR